MHLSNLQCTFFCHWIISILPILPLDMTLSFVIWEIPQKKSMRLTQWSVPKLQGMHSIWQMTRQQGNLQGHQGNHNRKSNTSSFRHMHEYISSAPSAKPGRRHWPTRLGQWDLCQCVGVHGRYCYGWWGLHRRDEVARVWQQWWEQLEKVAVQMVVWCSSCTLQFTSLHHCGITHVPSLAWLLKIIQMQSVNS